MAQNLLHHARIVNHGDDALVCVRRTGRHGALAEGTKERVGVPDTLNKVASFLGGEFRRRRRRDAGLVRTQLRGQDAVADATHFVAVIAGMART